MGFPTTSDRDWLIREFQANRVRLIAYIRSLAGDPDLTEDLFQEVSVVVLQKAGEFDSGRDLQAWCRGIARNLLLRDREKTRRLKPFSGDRLVELVDTAFQENGHRELVDAQRSLLRRCMDLLATPSREILDLRYQMGLSLRQISERLKRTEPSVQVALSRVRKWLSECIQKRAQGLEADA
jgi:RNA polymerase sigma-70 factor (ECF subfamily)